MEEVRAAFAHVPRTGGQSVRTVLGHLRTGEMHLTTAELRRRHGGSLLVYTFVRDPWDRAVSIAFLYRQRGITPAGFRAWVAGGMLHPCGRPATLYEGTPYAIDVTAPQVEFARGADWVGRFERLDRDFMRLCEWLGVEQRTLPHVNGVARPDSSEFYDDATLNRIGERYKEDIECFGHKIPTPASGA